ncbi:MAG: type II toxin-antitoxin system RelE/ParE family toxin [Kiritimatiellae bacterium]|nr:type II toxin-antitoxin system RelE/ParE family toxin [Kiritimatiellia bacterium]
MKVQVLEEATSDLADGYRFYESQAEGLGDYFLNSLWSDIHSLRLYSGIHVLHFGYHRLLSKRFPFAIYYRIECGIARVRAVLDCRQDPERISGELK